MTPRLGMRGTGRSRRGACCEWICERNAAQLTRSHTRQWHRLDGRWPAACTFETRETSGNRDWLAHNPQVAGSNPVPATSGNGSRKPLRGHFLAGWFGRRWRS
jgi:hypothetical protein